MRILNEAEFFAPSGYQKHLDNISTAYVRILRRARLAARSTTIVMRSSKAIVPHVHGARGYLSRRYSYSPVADRRARARDLRLHEAGHARAFQNFRRRQR